MVTVAPSALEAYVGSYEMQPGVNIVFSVENGHLMMQPPGSPAKLLFSLSSETTFFTTTPLMQIEFAKDEKDVVTHVTFKQATREFKAVRK